MAMFTHIRTIDGLAALNLLARTIGERVDFVYCPPGGGDRCLYAYDGGPSCLVGRVLYQLGVSVSDLAAFDATRKGAGALRNMVFTAGADDGDSDDAAALLFTRDASYVLAAAQIAQDTGETWGAALERARQRYDEIHAGGAA